MLITSTVAARICLWWCVLQSLCVMVHAWCAITPDSNGHVDIPSTWSEIPKDSFKECTALKTVIIPDSVTTIGNEAFRGCRSLTSVPIPDSVTTIGNEAFRGCRSLTSVPIPDSAATIGHGLYGLMYQCDRTGESSVEEEPGRALSFLKGNEWENRRSFSLQ